MKKILTIAIILLVATTVFTACSGKKENTGGSGTLSAQESRSGGGRMFRIPDEEFYDDVDIVPDVLKNGIGTLKELASPSYETFGNVVLRFTNVNDSAFETLKKFYTDNGGRITADSGNEFDMTFSWGTLRATHFGFDEEVTVRAKLN